MKVIALDSSGLVASAAIMDENGLVAEYNIQHRKNHSQTLLPMLAEICRMAELDLVQVDAIVLAAGPGSFTGLRIGSATAKGLGFALDKPIVEIPTLDGLAYNLYGSEQLVCPIMDARRNQVYTGVYAFKSAYEGCRMERDKVMETLLPQCAAAIESIAGQLNCFGREVVFLGDGVPVYRERLRELMQVPYGFAPSHMSRQRAAALAELGLCYLKQGLTIAAAEHAPVYLRLSQAERERTERLLIRPLEIGDVEAVCDLEARVFTMPWKAQDFLEMIKADYAYYYVAETENDRKIVGMCGVRNIAGEGQITNVAVDTAYRRKGIARKLLTHLLAEALKSGMDFFSLEVRAGNQPAIRLYESLGFTGQGIRPGFYDKPEEDALIMEKYDKNIE